MGILELSALAVGLSMDAFAVAVCIGLTATGITLPKSAAVGAYFGTFQAAMPLIGFLTAGFFFAYIAVYSRYIAFAALAFLGAKMIKESFTGECAADCCGPDGILRLSPFFMAPYALATSIDALAAGVSLRLTNAPIIPAVALAGFITFFISTLGVKAGASLGVKLKSKAGFAGGAILILIGLRILLGELST